MNAKRWLVQTTILVILAMIFAGDTLFLVLVPVSMKASGVSSGVFVGVVIACAQGLGVLVAAPFGMWSDARRRSVPIMIGGLVAAGAIAFLIGAAAGGNPWLWVMGALLFGIVRVVMISTTLAAIVDAGDLLRMQGFTSAVQRGAAIMAAALGGALIAQEQWTGGFMAIAGCGVLVALLARVGAPRVVHDELPKKWIPGSYLQSLRLLTQRRAVLAAALLNAALGTMILAGNSFYGVTLDVVGSKLGTVVACLLVSRDVTAVLVGLVFRKVFLALGLRGVVFTILFSAGPGVALLSVSGTNYAFIIAAGVLQGIATALAIATANVLAIEKGVPGGLALRMITSAYVVSAATLVAPIVFGALLPLGGRVVFATAALAIAAMLSCVLWLASRLVGSAKPTVFSSSEENGV